MFVYMRNLKRSKEKDEKVIAELSAANERVIAANETKTRFLQNMTHEIRTPMNAISGFSQLLATSGDLLSPEEKNEFSGYIINNTRMMSMLLDDIIASQLMDKGEYKVNMEESDCETICRNAIMAAEHRLQPGVQMRFVPSVELPFRFVTDPMRATQVLTNLLTNACKHTREGEIRLGCTLDETAGMIAFSVEDTGPGIPESEAEHIFERFVKLDNFVQGTGLGLSISREIASNMGGSVFLDTSYSPGARFVFTLPDSHNL
jgi:signal transduction histidine kinase